MIIHVQFFPDYKETATSPISEKEGSLGIFEVEYDPAYQDVILEDGVPVIIVIGDIPPPPPETPQEKHTRVYRAIVTAEDLAEVDLEGEVFTDEEIGKVIRSRAFGGNIDAQLALMRKVARVHEVDMAGGTRTAEHTAIIAYADAKDAEIEAILTFFYS